MTDRFREIAHALQPFLRDSGSLLAAVEAVVSIDESAGRLDKLVATALETSDVVGYMQCQKKVQAIKALRDSTGCGLKEAKDAVEAAMEQLPPPDPWDNFEPPF